MKILALGDAVGSVGCNHLKKYLPAFKKEHNIDFCICNGENSAEGNGITPDSARMLFSAGVDFITTGNHVYRRKEVYDFLDENEFIIRPCNYNPANPGVGSRIIDCGFFNIGIINVMGTVYLESLENPFAAAERELRELEEATKLIFIDLHAEATSEKKAMGYFFDGRVTALFGTHTHVQTADNTILKGGTGYITDLGMCGPDESILGVECGRVIDKLRFNMPAKFETAKGSCTATGCIFTADPKSGKCLDTELIAF